MSLMYFLVLKGYMKIVQLFQHLLPGYTLTQCFTTELWLILPRLESLPLALAHFHTHAVVLTEHSAFEIQTDFSGNRM